MKKLKLLKLLHIDDDKEDQALVKSGLNGTGMYWDIKCVPDGEDIEKIYFDFEPDAVLIDINLKRESGFDVCRKIRNLNSQVTIIIYTGDSYLVDTRASVACGANALIVKTSDMSLVKQEILKFMETQNV